ncbi:glycosyltransferase family 39 protein [Telmatocola sphagniphila]|uniref:Glycosyltransferase family 39 protein n=1 Tax=Telmatocola sphagniphila TaxID=1123043 RepID=A0A8E6B653_9BACT|nr:glycosyltransferase family 39 protein [Telmatocola sphagniphila]QVL32805.1 glycosyltransferase family 39 protein [Telmatocola sphagniphila]
MILTTVMALCTFPNLGTHSLWDVDEGVNAEAAREMLEAGTWIVPTFNYELRTAKPVMLYWWQMASYKLFGISEWSARLPSVLAGFGTVFITYFLGRRMFDAMTGLISGLLLTTAIEFCLLSHTASPDSILVFFTTLSFYCFWRFSENGGRGWFIPMAAACALAVLTKGPIGVGLPGLVVLVYLGWNKQLSRLWDRKLIQASLVFLLLALPWYVMVGVETRGEFLRVFFGRENISRFTTPMENHSGNPFFHLIALIIGFAPGSIFLGLAFWEAVKQCRTSQLDYAPYRLLLTWFAVYLAVFSIAATKLPNYVFPLYPATAIVCGRFVERWRSQQIAGYSWGMPVALSALLLVGLITIAGLLIASGAITLPIKKMRVFPGLEKSAWVGMFPLLGAIAGYYFWLRGNRNRILMCITTSAVGFMTCLAAFPILQMDQYKAPRALVEESQLRQRERDIRIASIYWFKPTTVFYTQREILKLEHLEDAVSFLNSPRESYLILTENTWKELEKDLLRPFRLVSQHYDFYEDKNVLVISNRP